MESKIKTEAVRTFIFIVFLGLTIWWILLFISGSKTGFPNYLFGAVYGPLMSFIGAIIGLKISLSWGGTKSILGKTIFALSVGLLASFFGQVVFSYYNIFLKVEIPYPSVADIGFFANIPMYLYAMTLLLGISGGKVTLKSTFALLQAVVIPLGLLTISYLIFLKHYEFDLSQPLKIFLDFAYPLGQALYVSAAILTYTVSRKLLGGIMKGKIVLIIVAFVMQYVADFNFLYQTSQGTWYNGGYGDYLYLVAYTVMTLSLLELRMSNIRKSLS